MALDPDVPGQRIPGPPHKRTAEEILKEHEAEKRRSQRPVEPGDRTEDPLRTKTFARDGLLVVMDRPSGTVWVPEQDIVVVGATAWLGDAAADGTTTIHFQRNGADAGHVTWDAGDDVATAAIELALAADQDRLTVQCTAAGDGAYGATIRFRYVLGR